MTALAKIAEPEAKAATTLSSTLLGDVLGPSARALGQHFARKIEQWSENHQAKNVLQLASKKIDSSIPGSVPPRVAASVLDSSLFTSDVFVAEYLSGVLASARTIDGTDDSGVSWSALVDRLSSDALRLHFVIYSILRRQMRGVEVGVMAEWCRKYIIITYIDLLPVFGSDEAWGNSQQVLNAAYVLQREGMLDFLTHGSANHLTGPPFGQYALPNLGDMLIVSTTIQGAQLYLQGHGFGGSWADRIANVDTNFDVAGDIEPRLSEVPGSFLDQLPKK
ncbi:hypothetical protein [Paeniglutamicibacter psychrophenolicus]|uniref:hypothetical protein n=1 Tax=Paeniglutamicibacter psychrophenolicus TaxID=257454 RepID=UPI001AE259A9|nr:hypothetical protein [Paeniglutamicibacter psychrophenolicus]